MSILIGFDKNSQASITENVDLNETCIFGIIFIETQLYLTIVSFEPEFFGDLSCIFEDDDTSAVQTVVLESSCLLSCFNNHGVAITFILDNRLEFEVLVAEGAEFSKILLIAQISIVVHAFHKMFLGGFTECHAISIGDVVTDVGDLSGPVLRDGLKEFFAAIIGNINIDIWDICSQIIHEASQLQIKSQGIYLRDAEQKADKAGACTSSDNMGDLEIAHECNNLLDLQKDFHKSELFDECEFLLEACFILLIGRALHNKEAGELCCGHRMPFVHIDKALQI